MSRRLLKPYVFSRYMFRYHRTHWTTLMPFLSLSLHMCYCICPGVCRFCCCLAIFDISELCVYIYIYMCDRKCPQVPQYSVMRSHFYILYNIYVYTVYYLLSCLDIHTSATTERLRISPACRHLLQARQKEREQVPRCIWTIWVLVTLLLSIF